MQNRRYPVCIDGRRACPPEDCGGPWAFMALLEQFSLGHIIMRLTEIIEDGDDLEDHCDELFDLQYWLTAERFDRKGANRRLYDYAHGNDVFMWA